MKSQTPERSRWRRRLFALFASVAFLVLLEGSLRLFGFGRSYPLFVPVPEAPQYLRTNLDVVRRFMVDENQTPNLWIRPVYFQREKGPETFRIFVLGGSTAAGYPYGYVASPAGMLQQRLQRTFPEKRIEVVTTAMSAVNSYTLLDFTDEILEHEPDAVLIYAGHNEYVGILGVGSGFSAGLRRPTVLAFLLLRDLRIFQLVQRIFSAVGPEGPDRSDRTLMATIVRRKSIPLDSALYRRGLEQYRANLSAILGRYGRAGVPVFLGTLVSNERDQPPFIAGPRTGADAAAWERRFEAGRRALEAGDPLAALEELDAAVATDDEQAEGHYARGRALDRLGRFTEARRAYLAAKDRDELRFRAPEEFNDILRELVSEHGAHIVEVQEAFVRASPDGIVGGDLMLEHLHPNVRGYFLLADAYYEALRSNEMIGPWTNPIPLEDAWEEIPVTEVDRLYGEYRIGYLTSDWPFSRHKELFRIEPATSRVEWIAQDYYREKYQWPDAMDNLLEHYRSVDDELEAAKVGVLLAEAFPNEAERQMVAAELAARAGRPEADVYLGRALEAASPRDEARLRAIQGRLQSRR